MTAIQNNPSCNHSQAYDSSRKATDAAMQDFERQIDKVLEERGITEDNYDSWKKYDQENKGEFDLAEKLRAAADILRQQERSPQGSGIGEPTQAQQKQGQGGGGGGGDRGTTAPGRGEPGEAKNPGVGDLTEALEKLDANGDGIVSAEELEDFLGKLGIENVDSKALAELLNDMDEDQDGVVKKDEAEAYFAPKRSGAEDSDPSRSVGDSSA